MDGSGRLVKTGGNSSVPLQRAGGQQVAVDHGKVFEYILKDQVGNSGGSIMATGDTGYCNILLIICL